MVNIFKYNEIGNFLKTLAAIFFFFSTYFYFFGLQTKAVFVEFSNRTWSWIFRQNPTYSQNKRCKIYNKNLREIINNSLTVLLYLCMYIDFLCLDSLEFKAQVAIKHVATGLTYTDLSFWSLNIWTYIRLISGTIL